MFRPLHNDKPQSSHIASFRGNVPRRGNRLKKTSRAPSTVPHKRRRQNNVAALLQFPQRLQTSASLGHPEGIEESVVPAELIRESCSVHAVIAIKHRADMCDGFRLSKCSFNLVLSFHASRVHSMKVFVQLYLGVKSRSRRLISLAPTQTEIVAALGAVGDLLGATEDCDFPDCVRGIPRFGSWYSPDIRAILDAGPDLVLTFGSHQAEVRDVLEESGVRVYHSEPHTIAAALDTFGDIASLIGREKTCRRLIKSLEERLGRIRQNLESAGRGRRPSVFRVMNWDPLVTPGPGAFQHDVIEFAGGANTAADSPAAYFVCDPEQIRARDPEIIFFCEPGIKAHLENDAEWAKVSAVRNGRIYIYDCGLTCRSGPRIVDMAEELNRVVLDFLGVNKSL